MIPPPLPSHPCTPSTATSFYLQNLLFCTPFNAPTCSTSMYLLHSLHLLPLYTPTCSTSMYPLHCTYSHYTHLPALLPCIPSTAPTPTMCTYLLYFHVTTYYLYIHPPASSALTLQNVIHLLVRISFVSRSPLFASCNAVKALIRSYSINTDMSK